MKSIKNLEKLLNKKGYELDWKKFSYFDCVPYAVKNGKEIPLCFNTFNTIYRSDSILTVLEMNMTGKELEHLLDKMEKIEDKICLGNITYTQTKRIVTYSYEYFE